MKLEETDIGNRERKQPVTACGDDACPKDFQEERPKKIKSLVHFSFSEVDDKKQINLRQFSMTAFGCLQTPSSFIIFILI